MLGNMTMVQTGGARRPPTGLIKETTTQTFVKDVIEESKRQPVLIDFWAPWCGPCKQLTPILEKVVKAAKGKVKLVKMNIDEHPAIPGQMGIQSIPAVIAFVNGQPADGFMGALPESQVTAFLERLTKGKVGGEDQGPAEGGRRGAGRRATPPAPPTYTRRCWQRTAPTSPALAGLARAMSRPARSSRPSRRSPWCRKPSATTRRSRPRARRSSSPSRRTRSARSPSSSRRSRPIRSTIRRASISRSRSTPRASAQEAVDQLMEIVQRDRKWNDDGARKQLVQFFEAWGPTDEATVAGRKRLSSILFCVDCFGLRRAAGGERPCR